MADENLEYLPPVLDACCGPRAMWFDKSDPRALFVDVRQERHVSSREDEVIEISPDLVADFTDLPFPDNSFRLVVFDPPHIERLEALGDVSRRYGVLLPGWREALRAGFEECFRVLRPGGVLICKWCEVEIPLREVLALTPERPLFGHRSGKQARTHWVAFLKGGET